MNKRSIMIADQVAAAQAFKRHTMVVTSAMLAKNTNAANTTMMSAPQANQDQEDEKDVQTHLMVHPEVWSEFAAKYGSHRATDKNEATTCLAKFFN